MTGIHTLFTSLTSVMVVTFMASNVQTKTNPIKASFQIPTDGYKSIPIQNRSYEHTFIPQSWNSFQRLRQHDVNNSTKNVTTRAESRNYRTSKFVNQPTPSSKDTFKVSLVTRNDSSQCSKPTERKPSHYSVRHDRRWARTWANHRAHQAVLTRNQFSEKSSERSKSCETQRTDKTLKMNVPRSSVSTRSRNIELDPKAAEVFSRLRSIYVNEEERNRRLQCIRDRMNEFQKTSIKKEVNKSIHEFNKKLKEDEQNRKELRRVREKFLETKKQRLKHMHVSRNALEVPAVSRLAYGLPQEGKEFSVPLSSKKTTDEIKNLWRMAFIRKQCIDSFINKVSKMHPELPGVTVKPRLRAPSLTSDLSSRPEHLHGIRPKKDHLEEIEESKRRSEINSLAKLQTGILDTFESLSSDEDEDDYEK